MLTKSMQITLDSRTPNLKTVTCAQMAGKEWNCIVYSCFPKSGASEPFQSHSRISANGDSDHQVRVSVDNRNGSRLDYRVAEKTKDLRIERIHSGCSFLSNARAGQPAGVCTGRPERLAPLQLESSCAAPFVTKGCCPYGGRNESVKRRISGPFVVL